MEFRALTLQTEALTNRSVGTVASDVQDISRADVVEVEVRAGAGAGTVQGTLETRVNLNGYTGPWTTGDTTADLATGTAERLRLDRSAAAIGNEARLTLETKAADVESAAAGFLGA